MVIEKSKLNMRSSLFILLFSTIACSASAQFGGGNKWEDGYFYDAAGEKILGQIVANPSGKAPEQNEAFILFRTDKGADKEHLTASMVKSFVIGRDSFTVAHAPNSEDWPGKSIDFVKVLVNEPLKLYSVNGSGGGGLRPGFSPSIGIGGGSFGSAMGGGLGISLGGGRGKGKSAYYYGDGPNSLTELKKDNFIPIMTEVMASEPEIVEKIKNKKYKYHNIEQLITDFNKAKEGQSGG